MILKRLEVDLWMTALVSKDSLNGVEKWPYIQRAVERLKEGQSEIKRLIYRPN